MKYRPRKFSRHSIMYVKEESSDHSDDDSFVPSSGSDPGSSSHEDNEYAEFLAEKEAEEAVIKQKKKCTRRKKKRKGPLLLWEIWEEEQDRWVDDHLTEDVDLDHQHGVPIKTLEAPPDLNISLLRYQKEWLDWALKQEDSPTKGGILADEMGMGKTIQAIALVLAKREHRTPIPDQPSSSSGGLPEGLTAVKGTLVICPVVALTQWASEIDRFTSRGSTRVLVYHGPNRVNSVNQLMDYDFVITTYSIVEYDFRKFVMVPKKICPYCGHAYNKKGLLLHLRFYCGPNAAKTESQSKQEKKKLKPHADYKDNKKRPKKKALESEISGKGKSPLVDTAGSLAKEDSLLHSVMWDRIILDEAHFVKDRRCNTARAVLALESSYKWALSGTPLQNRVGELYSLIRFLRIVPYSYYLCKDCDCRTLDYR